MPGKFGVWKPLREGAVECVLAEKSDYDGGDPELSLTRHDDGTYDFVIYRGVDDLRVHDLSAEQVRRAAMVILTVVPKLPNED